MPTLGQLNLADGQATPVTQAFTVSQNVGTFISWLAKIGSLPIAWPRITFAYLWNKTNTLYRPKWTIELPCTETVNGVTKRVAFCRIVCEAYLPEAASAAVRADLVAYAKATVNGGGFASIINGNETYF